MTPRRLGIPVKGARGYGTLALGLLAVAVLCPRFVRRGGDFADVPLSRSAYLRGVAEPITMVNALSWDDGGSKGLAFRDARQTTRYACLLDDLDDRKNLILGSFTPSRREGIVPVGGVEERAFLGLLERWYRRDPGARAWELRIKHWREARTGYGIFTGRETDQERATAFAVSIREKLRERNSLP